MPTRPNQPKPNWHFRTALEMLNAEIELGSMTNSIMMQFFEDNFDNVPPLEEIDDMIEELEEEEEENSYEDPLLYEQYLEEERARLGRDPPLEDEIKQEIIDPNLNTPPNFPPNDFFSSPQTKLEILAQVAENQANPWEPEHGEMPEEDEMFVVNKRIKREAEPFEPTPIPWPDFPDAQPLPDWSNPDEAWE